MTARKRANGEGTIYQRSDNKLWIASTPRQNGQKPKPFSGRTRAEAIAKRATWLKEIDAGLNPKADKWLLGDWLDYVLERKQPHYDAAGNKTEGIEPTTWQKYETNLRLHTTSFIGSVPLRELTRHPEILERWQADLRTHGRSAETRKQALTFVSQALKLAMQRRLIQFNPADSLERPRPAKPRHVQPSEKDLAALLRAIQGDPLEALVWIGLGAGLRRAEVAGLHWEDVTSTPGAAVLHAHRRVNLLGRRAQRQLDMAGPRLEREGLKNQPERFVNIGGLMLEVLARRWTYQASQALLLGERWQGPVYGSMPTGYLFTTDRGAPIHVNDISRYFSEVRERAGLDINRFHGLRRAFTTLLDKAGVSDRVTMELAGHKQLDMTHHYQQPMESDKRAAADALDAQLRRILDLD